MIGAAFGQETRKEGFQHIINSQKRYFANNETGDIVKRNHFEKNRLELKRNADYHQVMEMQGKKNAQGAEVIPRAEARENHCAKGRGDQRKAEARRNEVHRDHPGHGDREAKPRYFEGNMCFAQCPGPDGGQDRTEAVRVRRAEDHPSSCDARCGGVFGRTLYADDKPVDRGQHCSGILRCNFGSRSEHFELSDLILVRPQKVRTTATATTDLAW